MYMENQPPPLTPEEIAAAQTAQYADTGQPQVVKVFGIMHVLLGAYGVFSTLLAVAAMAGFNPLRALIAKGASASAQTAQQTAMQSEMLPYSIGMTIIGIVTTIFIFTAGILILKKRRRGLKWSNRYAWVSLAGKVIGLIFTFLYTYPITMKMMSGSPGGSSMPGGMEWIMIGSMLFGIVITCVYPILALILLNRPRVKEWFDTQPD